MTQIGEEMTTLGLSYRYEVLCENRLNTGGSNCRCDAGHFSIPGTWPSGLRDAPYNDNAPSTSDGEPDESLKAVSIFFF